MAFNSILCNARIDDIDFSFYDLEGSIAAQSVVSELLHGCYPLDGIDFSPGDIVVDIGAHVGVFSIWLAKKFPFVNILAYEALPINYANCQRNIALNGVSNISLNNMLVSSKSGEKKEIWLNRENTGGSSLHIQGRTETNEMDTISLDDILKDIAHCKMLKIDVEGHEYEILSACTQLEKVEWFLGEMHINATLSMKGYSMGHLWQHLASIIDPEKIRIGCCNMAE